MRTSMRRGRASAYPAVLLVATTAMIGACAGERRDSAAPATDTTAAQIAAVEALSIDSILATVPTAAAARARFDVLSESLSIHPDHERAPIWLWEAGVIGRDGLAEFLRSVRRRSPDTVFIRRHPQAFWYNEVGGSYIYRGWHFTELVRRFPDHQLADDASFAYAGADQGGECEGSFSCYMERGTARYTAFVNAYPSSRHARAAVDTINGRMQFLFAAFDTGSVEFHPADTHDVQAVDSALVRYARALALTPPPVRAHGYAVLANLFARWGFEAQAAGLYRALLGELATFVADTTAVRLESGTRYLAMRERDSRPEARRQQ